MKVAAGTFNCANGHAFEAPLLGDFVYGEFLLRSEHGRVAYLNTFEDETFDEVADIVRQLAPSVASNQGEAADLIQSLYGPSACDPDPEGAPYRIGGPDRCPICAGAVASWDVSSPPKSVEVAPVTHERWSALSADEKTQILARAATDRG